MKKYIFIAIILATAFLSCKQESKTAYWITHPEVSEGKNVWLAFKKEFDYNSNKSIESIARIAVDSKYWLYLNDSLVLFEGGLKRGPNPNDTYVDEVDLQPYLKRGKNTLAVLVWHFGKDGFCHKSSGKAGLFFEMKNKKLQLVSDSTWQVMVHPAFGNTKWPHPNYRLPESNIRFDAQKDCPDWFKANKSLQMAQAVMVGKEGVAPWNQLKSRPIPQWFDSGWVEYEKTVQMIKGDHKIIHAYLPKNISVTPYFKIEAPQGKTIDIRTDNYKGGGAFNIRAEYITKSGVQEFETYAYMNGHYVIYSFPKEVEIIEVKYRETRYNAEVIGGFSCEDPFYNRLWEKAVNTLNINMRDNFMDCPDRERSQWWGDVVILLGEIYYTLDTNGQKAIDKAVRNLVDWQREDGSLYSPVPAGNWHNELPTQMLASIGKYGFWLNYEYSGDSSLIRYVYPSVKKYLSLWDLNDEGLVKQRKGGWTWLDWGQKIDSSLVFNTWYYMALESAMNMAQLMGDQPYYASCQSNYEKLHKAFNKAFWDGKSYRSQKYKFGYDDRGNGLAVVAGLADSSKFEAISKTLSEVYQASPYLEKYILEALFLMDKPTQALERMKQRFAKMINSNLSTLWEGWGIGNEGYGGGSYNHGWSGGGLTMLAQYVAGVSPLEPGFKSIKIAPQLGGLKHINLVLPLNNGVLDLQIDRSEKEIEIKINNELKRPIEVHLPAFDGTKFNRIKVNGEKINQNIKDQSKEIQFCGYDKGCAVLKVSNLTKVGISAN